jgi:hypothetical protein
MRIWSSYLPTVSVCSRVHQYSLHLTWAYYNRYMLPGASLYVRPFVFGSGARLGLGPSPEHKFIVSVTPVGAYYKGALSGIKGIVIDEFDRCAPRGTGHVKAGGNYAADLVPSFKAKAQGYPIALYLDALTHTYIEEFSTSNFIAITSDGKFVTPASPSVLDSVTNRTLGLAAQDLGLIAERRPITFAEVRQLCMLSKRESRFTRFLCVAGHHVQGGGCVRHRSGADSDHQPDQGRAHVRVSHL